MATLIVSGLYSDTSNSAHLYTINNIKVFDQNGKAVHGIPVMLCEPSNKQQQDVSDPLILCPLVFQFPPSPDGSKLHSTASAPPSKIHHGSFSCMSLSAPSDSSLHSTASVPLPQICQGSISCLSPSAPSDSSLHSTASQFIFPAFSILKLPEIKASNRRMVVLHKAISGHEVLAILAEKEKKQHDIIMKHKRKAEREEKNLRKRSRREKAETRKREK